MSYYIILCYVISALSALVCVAALLSYVLTGSERLFKICVLSGLMAIIFSQWVLIALNQL